MLLPPWTFRESSGSSCLLSDGKEPIMGVLHEACLGLRDSRCKDSDRKNLVNWRKAKEYWIRSQVAGRSLPRGMK